MALNRFVSSHIFAFLVSFMLVGAPERAWADSAAEAEVPKPLVTFGGYVEAFYQWNFNEPTNGITNYRGFDNRHNSFTLANAVLSASWDVKNLVGKLAFQVGHTPSTYYLAEPYSMGSNGANFTGPELWKYIQQANVGYRFGIGRGLLFEAGVFLSPIGPEGMAIRDNWNWSRSNLFFGLPFYHTGARISYPFTSSWTVTLAGYNGWNSIVDGNDEKSISIQATYARIDKFALSMLYFGGVERPKYASEGRPWRHLVDLHATWHPNAWLSVIGHLNGGSERNDVGTSAWLASALYARIRATDQLHIALRGDIFRERTAANAQIQASSIFWPVPWVGSAAATVDYRPHEQTSFRLEFRHDRAAGNMFFGGAIARSRQDASFIANRQVQNTLTLGATTWF